MNEFIEKKAMMSGLKRVLIALKKDKRKKLSMVQAFAVMMKAALPPEEKK